MRGRGMARKASWKKEYLGSGLTNELDAHWLDSGEKDIPDREIGKCESTFDLWKRVSGRNRKRGWKGGVQKAKVDKD